MSPRRQDGARCVAVTRRAMASPVLLALLALAACTTGEPDPQPFAETVIVEGVLPGQGPSEAYVRFERLGAVPGSIRAAVNSDRGFRVEVPAGDYRVAVNTWSSSFWYRRDGTMTHRQSAADTLRLAPSPAPVRLRFGLGSLRVFGSVPLGRAFSEVAVSAKTPDAGDGWPDVIAAATQAGVGGVVDCVIELLPAGDYRVELEWREDYEHQGERYFLPGVPEPDSARTYHVGVDSICLAGLSHTVSAARLEGRVTGVWEAYATEAPSIAAFDTAGTLVFGPWRVEPDGTFSLGFLHPRPVRLSVQVGFEQAPLGGATASTATVFRPTPDAVTAAGDHAFAGALVRLEANLNVPQGNRASVRFRDPGDHRLLKEATVELGRDQVVPLLPAGTYLVEVAHTSPASQPWRPQWFDGVDAAGQATPVTFAVRDELVRLRMTLERGGLISGRCEGTAESYWNVALLTTADSDTVLHTRWLDPWGGQDFSWNGLADGAYKVGMCNYTEQPRVGEPAPAASVWHAAATDWNAAAPVIIAGADSVTGLVLPAP